MGSLGVMEEGVSRDRYGYEKDIMNSKVVPEGVEGRVPYRGPLTAILDQLIGGVKSGMGYVGCRNLSELSEKAQFTKISAYGNRESHVHDVTITKEAPNYRL